MSPETKRQSKRNGRQIALSIRISLRNSCTTSCKRNVTFPSVNLLFAYLCSVDYLAKMVMGNAGDIEGQVGPSGVKKFEENCEHNMELGQGGTLPNYPVPGIMDYAPSLPRPYQSPFNPEVLVTSMRGPTQIVRPQIHSLPQSIIENKEDSYGRWISAEITWNNAGNLVSVMGSWDNWQTIELLQHTGKSFTLRKVLPLGIHYCRFIVDGALACASDLPWICDGYGNGYNILNLQEEVQRVPSNVSAHLYEFESPPSPPSSYDNRLFTNEDFYQITKEGKVRELQPPELPPELEVAVLDKPPPPPNIHHSLSGPEVSQLNHLYTYRNDNDQFDAFTSTERFGQKCFTAVLFKPLPKTR